jgi:hypothetical protein
VTKLFATQAVTYSDPVRFTTPGRYSMPVAVEILQQLEIREDCEILNAGWKSSGYGALVERGIPVRLGTIQFEIMCSYGDIFFRRLSGNKAKFYEFCESVREMDLAS